MLLYSFKCEKCEKEKDILLAVEDISTFSTNCCGQKMSRIFTTNVVFKGPGFASNDSRIDKDYERMMKAITDDTPVTQTMEEEAEYQLEKRAEKQGKTKEELTGLGKPPETPQEIKVATERRAKQAVAQRAEIEKTL